MKQIRLDKRTREYRNLHLWFNRYTRAAAVAGLIVGSLITLAYVDYQLKQPLPELLSPLSEVQGMEVTPTPKPFCRDVISCIRDIGEQEGYQNYVIREMIRIAKCESGYRLNAKNPTSTATGIFQILTGTWGYAKCEGSRTNMEDNIRCAYKVRDLQGNSAWNASKHCWKQ